MSSARRFTMTRGEGRAVPYFPPSVPHLVPASAGGLRRRGMLNESSGSTHGMPVREGAASGTLRVTPPHTAGFAPGLQPTSYGPASAPHHGICGGSTNASARRAARLWRPHWGRGRVTEPTPESNNGQGQDTPQPDRGNPASASCTTRALECSPLVLRCDPWPLSKPQGRGDAFNWPWCEGLAYAGRLNARAPRSFSSVRRRGKQTRSTLRVGQDGRSSAAAVWRCEQDYEPVGAEAGVAPGPHGYPRLGVAAATIRAAVVSSLDSARCPSGRRVILFDELGEG